MGLFRFLFEKKSPTLVRCTFCYDEFYLSPREVRLMERDNASDPACPIKEECHICHMGFVIPVKYSDKHGKLFLYHELKPKIKNLDPDTLIQGYTETSFLNFEIPKHLINICSVVTRNEPNRLTGSNQKVSGQVMML